jgi:glycosyltransferase involved in cell wall biosynthesis
MPKADVLVSVVAVAGDQPAVLPAFVADALAVLDREYANYELLLVDPGTCPDTVAVARGLLSRHRCVRYLRLAGRPDAETAATAGLEAAIGDYVVCLDPDLDPPEEIPAMVARCRDGADLVVGSEIDPPRPGPAYRLLRRLFAFAARHLLDVEYPVGATACRAFTRAAANAVTRVRTRRRHPPVLAAEAGLSVERHPYRRACRSGGRPGPRLVPAARHGLSVLVHHSIRPLRLVSVLGLAGSLACFLYSGYVVAVYALKADVLPGWTTLSLQMAGLAFLLFVMLTLIGEYVGRVLEEVSDRPLYHVREEGASAVMLADAARLNVLDRSADEAA